MTCPLLLSVVYRGPLLKERRRSHVFIVRSKEQVAKTYGLEEKEEEEEEEEEKL